MCTVQKNVWTPILNLNSSFKIILNNETPVAARVWEIRKSCGIRVGCWKSDDKLILRNHKRNRQVIAGIAEMQ